MHQREHNHPVSANSSLAAWLLSSGKTQQVEHAIRAGKQSCMQAADGNTVSWQPDPFDTEHRMQADTS